MLDIGGGQPPGLPLAKFLDKLPSLRNIHLAGAGLLRGGIESLTPGLSCLEGLETLNLARNRIDDAGAMLLAELSHCVHLRCLNLEESLLKDCCVLYLSETIGRLSRLQCLCLKQNDIGSVGAHGLVEQFPKLRYLSESDLSHSAKGNATAVELARHPGELSPLKALAFHRSRFGDEGLSELAPALGSLTSPDNLRLSGNRLTCEGIVKMSPYLQNSCRASTLGLEIESNRRSWAGMNCSSLLGYCQH